MHTSPSYERWISPPLIFLPAVYVVAVILTAAISAGTPGGVYYRIISINPLAAGFLWVARDTVSIVVLFLITGTPWWYVIGQIGWASCTRRMSRLGSGIGAILSGITFLLCTQIAIEDIKDEPKYGLLSKAGVWQYLLIGILCLGALVCTIYAIIRFFRKDIEPIQASVEKQ